MISNRERTQQIILSAIAALFVIGVGIYGYKQNHNSKIEKIVASKESIESDTLVLKSNYKSYLKEYKATYLASNGIVIKSNLEGEVKNVLIGKGQYIEKGKTIAYVETKLSEETLELAKERYKELQSDLDKEQENLASLDINDSASIINSQMRIEMLKQALVLANKAMKEMQQSMHSSALVSAVAGVVDTVYLTNNSIISISSDVMKVLEYGYQVTVDDSLIRLLENIQSLEKDNVEVKSYIEQSAGEEILFDFGRYVSNDTFKTKKDLFIPTKSEKNNTNKNAKAIFTVVYKDVIEVPNTALRQDEGGSYIINVSGEKLIIEVLREMNKVSLIKGNNLDGQKILVSYTK